MLASADAGCCPHLHDASPLTEPRRRSLLSQSVFYASSLANEEKLLAKSAFPQVLQVTPKDHTSPRHPMAKSVSTRVELRPRAAHQAGPGRPEQGAYPDFCFREPDSDCTARLRPDSVGEGRGVASGRGLAGARPRPKGQKGPGHECHEVRGRKKQRGS